jgi:predicted transcriptional regulator of viral defense system
VKLRSLSPTEAKVVLSLEADHREDLSLDGLQTRAGVSRGFARKLAHGLVRKGWLQRIGPGTYLRTPARRGPDAVPDTDPLRVGARLARPYYLGYATAAELLGLLPQVSRVYYVVTPVRGGSTVMHAGEFRRIRVARRSFFGTRTIRRRQESLVVSDVEKTLLDCLARPDLAGGLGGIVRMLESARNRVDWDRMERYLARLGQRSLRLRLGYLIERLPNGPAPPSRWLRSAVAGPRDPYVPLGPPKEFGRAGPRDSRWHIIRNVPDSLLFAEVDVR